MKMQMKLASAVLTLGILAAMAAAQAGNYCGVPVVHVEAGLRSYDHETMPS